MSKNSPKPAFMIEFATTEIDESCGMKLWYSMFETGQGIVRKEDVVKSAINQQIHADLRAIALMGDIRSEAIKELVDDILHPLTPEDRKDKARMELLYRRIGQFVAFALFKEPEIREKYDTLPIDSETILDRESLYVVARPDRVLKAKGLDEISYREYVPMPSGVLPKRWLESWQYNMRLHVGMAAAAEDIHQKINFGVVMGLSEGYNSIVDGRLVHPYVWAYRNKKDEWSTHLRNDNGVWLPAPLWEFPGGIVQWVKTCGKAVADNQFPFSPPITLNKTMLDSWMAKRLHREREIRSVQEICHANPYLRSTYFERRTAQCEPGYGEACPFAKMCWAPKPVLSPPKDGEFVPNILQQVEIKVGEVVQQV